MKFCKDCKHFVSPLDLPDEDVFFHRTPMDMFRNAKCAKSADESTPAFCVSGEQFDLDSCYRMRQRDDQLESESYFDTKTLYCGPYARHFEQK